MRMTAAKESEGALAAIEMLHRAGCAVDHAPDRLEVDGSVGVAGIRAKHEMSAG